MSTTDVLGTLSMKNNEVDCGKRMVSLFKKNNDVKKENKLPFTIVSISTDKTWDSTEIIIKTPQKEQHFEGKTSELVQNTEKAASRLYVKKINNLDKGKVKCELKSAVPKKDLLPLMTLLSLDKLPQSFILSSEKKAVITLEEAGIKELHFFRRKEDGARQTLCPVDECLLFFEDLCLLKAHLLQEHNFRPYKCDFEGCKWSFTSKPKLERHKNSHKNIKDFVCDINGCGKTFTTSFNLRYHQKEIHEKKPEFVCTVPSCDAAFHTQRGLDVHYSLHSDTSPSYRCEYEGCGRAYVTRNALCCHMRSHHHKTSDLVCQWEGCNKVFEVPCRLREHMRVHTGEKPFPCEYPDCSWAFMTSSKLKRHMVRHTQERKFPCTLPGCFKSFFRTQHLREHLNTHSNKKGFTCPVPDCNAQFAARCTVYLHLVKVHKKGGKKKNKQTEETNDLNEILFDSTASGGSASSIIFENLDQDGGGGGVSLKNKVVQIKNLLDGEDCYECPFENCGLKVFKKEKNLLKDHIINHHCPQLNLDNANIDSLTLLTGEEDVSSLLFTDSATLPSHIPGLITSDLTSNLPDLTEVSLIDQTQTVIDTTPTKASRHHRKTKCSSEGAARTSYTYLDIVQEKKMKRASNVDQNMVLDVSSECDVKLTTRKKQNEETHCGKMFIPPDCVLTDPQSLMDELYPQEDLQVLLLDPNSHRHVEFEPSTINLRDLE